MSVFKTMLFIFGVFFIIVGVIFLVDVAGEDIGAAIFGGLVFAIPGMSLVSLSRRKKATPNDDDQIYTNERPLPSAPGINAELPKEDASEPLKTLVLDTAVPVNAIVYIGYQDAKGQVSHRRITIHKLIPYGDDMAISAYCHERKANRTFLISRVIEMYDLDTGEQIKNPVEYFIQRFGDSDIGKYTEAMKRLEPQMLALSFIARADGRMVKAEREVMIDYILSQSGIGISRDVAHKEVKRLHCTLKDFNRSINEIAQTTIDERIVFMEYVDRIVDQKNDPDPIEVGAAEKIRGKLKLNK